MASTTTLAQGSWVTDGGLETDLIFNHGVDLPEFASFPLLDEADGTRLLTDYYAEYAAIARKADAGLVHPTHVAAALDGASWQDRLVLLRPNASTLSHEELDAMEVLDSGDLDLLTSSSTNLLERVPSVRVMGGCCGTDSRHIAALWGVVPPVDGDRA